MNLNFAHFTLTCLPKQNSKTLLAPTLLPILSINKICNEGSQAKRIGTNPNKSTFGTLKSNHVNSRTCNKVWPIYKFWCILSFDMTNLVLHFVNFYPRLTQICHHLSPDMSPFWSSSHFFLSVKSFYQLELKSKHIFGQVVQAFYEVLELLVF